MTRSSFDKELQTLTRLVSEMGGIAEAQVALSITALETKDHDVAARVVTMDAQVDSTERAIDQAAAFLDDPQGMRAVLDAIDRLAEDPRPAGSFPYGSPDLRRLRVGRYRVLYEITEDAIAVRHIARGTRS